MKQSIVVFFVGALAAGCSHAPLTPSEEYFIGRGVSANAIAASPVHDDAALEEYVRMVGLTIALESDRPETFQGYFFGVLKSDEINAFAAPGGFVFVTTGALKAMENEDELAGVLAHEIAHVNLRHPETVANSAADMAGVQKGAKVTGFVLGKFGNSRAASTALQLVAAFGMVLDTVAEPVLKGYSQDLELAADAKAVDLLSRPGVRYDPNALKGFIARLPKKDSGGIWSTHPSRDGRVKEIDKEIATRKIKPSLDASRTQRFKAMTAGLRGS